MSTIPLFKTAPDPESPGQLAAELAEAKRQYETTRQDVIQRGVTRVQEIETLKAELSTEQDDLELVIHDAKQ